MKKLNLLILIFVILFVSSCSVTKIANIKSGDIVDSTEVSMTDGNVNNLTEFETFGTFKENEKYVVEASN